ncbi:MAG: hypothetical protein Q8Q65_02585 [bacterium]|nr:hypothetical protein [bacterium]
MDRTILQVPMTKDLRSSAEAVALGYGFSSLQEWIRVNLSKLAKHQITISIEENAEYLTPKQESALAQKEANFLKDKSKEKVYTANSVDELMNQLDGND